MPGPLNEVLTELDSLVKLGSVNARDRPAHRRFAADAEQRGHGLASGKGLRLHFVFVGDPVTGRITIACLMGEILSNLGYRHSFHVVKVERFGLVGDPLGALRAVESTDPRFRTAR